MLSLGQLVEVRLLETRLVGTFCHEIDQMKLVDTKKCNCSNEDLLHSTGGQNI
jgi:hypothetical protein